MHRPDDCEHCQRDLTLFGEAFINSATDEHYDVLTMLRVHGLPRPEMREAVAYRFRMGVIQP